jgi:exonuclease VII large subunit
LFAKFLALKAELEQKGYFAQERKRPIPFLPKRVGVVTGNGRGGTGYRQHHPQAFFGACPSFSLP